MIAQSTRAWGLLSLAGWAAAVSAAGFSSGWTAAGLILWLWVALYPSDLIRPRGLGAWTLWVSWGAFSAVIGPEPLLGAAPVWGKATGVLIFSLAYSWWGRPHRRVWLFGVWAAAAVFGTRGLVLGAWNEGAVGFLAAAAGSLLFVRASSILEGGWRAAVWILRILFVLTVAAGLRGSPRSSVIEASGPGWSAAPLALERPASGFGPGRIEAALRSAGWEGSGPSLSEWVFSSVETGLPGGLLLLIATLYVLLPPAYGDRPREWERQACAGAVGGLAAASLFQGLFGRPESVLLWFTALACGAPGAEEEETRPFRISPAAAWAAVAACLAAPIPRLALSAGLRAGASDFGLAAAALVSPLGPEVLARRAEADLSLRPPQVGRALARYRRAARINPGAVEFERRAAEISRVVSELGPPVPRGRP